MGGGVQILISHLINFKLNSQIQYEVIYLIEKKRYNKFQKIPLCDKISEQIFVYDSRWNFYFTINKLKNLISDQSAVLVAHDWLELGMISQLKICNPVLSFLHGNYDYYYDLYLKHKQSVNLFLSVTDALRKKIIEHENSGSNSLIHYSFPTPDFEFFIHDYNTLRLLFIANDLNDSNKNFDYLPIIDQKLLRNGICIEWHIVGSGKTLKEIQAIFNTTSRRIKYHGYISNDLLQEIYQQANIFINCSNKEGLPVSLVEAMKKGLIPVVNSWDRSAYDLIDNSVNGFIIEENSPDYFANLIFKLNYLKSSLLPMSKMAYKKATETHSLINQIATFEKLLFETKSKYLNRKPKKIYGSRLDSPYIPNSLTTTLRLLKHMIYG